MTEDDRRSRPSRSPRLAAGELGPQSWAGRMAQQAGRLRLGRAALAEGMVRPRPAGWTGASGRGGIRAHRRGRRRQDGHSNAGGGDDPGARHRSAEREVPATHSHRRGHLVPAVQRAGQRLRSGRRHDAGRTPGQQMGDQRAEGLDHERAPRGLRIAAGAHECGPAQASGPFLLHPRYAAAGRGSCAAAPDERPRVVQPGVLHRRRGRARVPG